ncbi:MAG: AraC family transcriptional regulator [Phycisphaerae bacterium]|nr:AraC family transcriptional regulator [Phycisphaerae bacterium]
MRSQTEQTYQERILRVLVHIQGCLDEALSLDGLARIAHFSPFHFHRIFRGMVGESVKEHVRRLRLERAAFRLKTTDHSVTQIAFDAGYETHEAFTRRFRAMFDESPSAFREIHRAVPYPPSPCGVHFDPDGRVARFEPLREGTLPMEVRIKNIEPMRVAFMRHVGPYDQVGETWNKLCAWAGPRGLLGPQTTPLGLCHDDPDVTPADKIRYDACLPVDASFKPEGDVGVQEIDGGEYAVATHHGPYERLSETYAQLCGQWLPSSGRELRSSPPLEVYRNSPHNTAPEDLITEIHLPLKAK